MKIQLRKSLMAVAVSSLLVTPLAQATNGMFAEGTGAKSRAMGGSGVAYPTETGSIVTNPAAAVHLGDRYDAALGLFSPSPRSYAINGNDCSGGFPVPCGGGSLDGAQESDENLFFIPFLGFTWAIDEKTSVAFVGSALGGMNTTWEQNPFAPFGATGPMGINLQQMRLGMTVARKITDKFSFGITPSLVVQRFNAKGLGTPNVIPALNTGFTGFSVNPFAMTNNAHQTSNGLAVRIGAMYDLGGGLTLGAAYEPETNMTNFSRYAGLFAENGDLNIPSNYTIGLAWKASSDMTVALDYMKINYTDVAAMSNDAQRLTDVCGAARVGFIPATAATESTCLGGANGAGFGWDDMKIIKLGVEWMASEGMYYRLGWNHGDSPIETEDAVINILAPGVVEDHLTLGMTMAMGSDSEITIDYVHAFANDVSGDIPAAFGSFGPLPIPGTQGTAKIEMEQNFLEVGYGKRF